MTTYDEFSRKLSAIADTGRTAYRANFRRMAASGERFALALLPVTETRPAVGVIIEPDRLIGSGAFPGASVAVSDVQAKTEAATVAQLREFLRTYPII